MLRLRSYGYKQCISLQEGAQAQHRPTVRCAKRAPKRPGLDRSTANCANDPTIAPFGGPLRRDRPVISSGAALALVAVMSTSRAYAQRIDSFLSPAIPGFDRDAGVTVLSRLRPLYQEPGIRLGGVTLAPRLDESIGFDSNVNGINKGPSSGFVQPSASVTATSDWSRNRLGLQLGLDNYSYLGIGNENYTNVNVGVGGGITIGRSDLNIGYTHLEQHERGTDIGSVASSTPVAYNVDAVRSGYAIDSGRFTFLPNIDVRRYQFSNATVQGVNVSESYRNREVYTGGVTTRYELSQQRGLLLVVQGATSQFDRTQPGIPIPNSETALVLAGIDYQASGPWRYRLLAGGEFRRYQSSVYGNHTAPVLQADVIWTPTGLTTVTGFVRREIEDPQSELTSGYNYTTVSLTVDHELRRDILLQGRGTFQAGDYFNGGGSSTAYTGGASVSWFLNRRLRLSGDYDFTRQVGSNGSAFVSTSNLPTATLTPAEQLNTLTSGSYSRSVLLFGVHIGL